MTDNRTTELLPCLHCGGEAELKEYKPNVSGVAICSKCGARSPICKNDHTGGWKPKAIAAWNSRAELGSETCHMSFIDEYETASGEEEYLCECSECGYRRWEPAHDLPLFCSKCGRKVKR